MVAGLLNPLLTGPRDNRIEEIDAIVVTLPLPFIKQLIHKQHPMLVCQFIEGFGIRVMCQADPINTHLF